MVDLDRRDLGRVRHQELHERRVAQLTVRVVGEPFIEGSADALRHTALDLTLNHERVDDPATVMHHDVLEDLEPESPGIDPDVGCVAA